MTNQDYQNERILDEFRKLGAKLKDRKGVQCDILYRYRKVPLHAMFLYTSEDKIVGEYLLENWGALDSLSGNSCDLHPTLNQFLSQEDAYDFIERLDIIKESKFREYSKLPGIFFWSLDGEYEYVAFGYNATVEKIKNILRILFEQIKSSPTISTIKATKASLSSEWRLSEPYTHGGVFNLANKLVNYYINRDFGKWVVRMLLVSGVGLLASPFWLPFIQSIYFDITGSNIDAINPTIGMSLIVLAIIVYYSDKFLKK